MRVLLVDDHELFRSGLESLVQAWGHEVVGGASNGVEALTMTRDLAPDLILMDINLPKLNGLEAVRLIKSEMPDVRIVMVTVSEEPSDLFEAIKAGAEGYLLKNMSEEEFRTVMDAIDRGEPPLSPGLARQLLQEFSRISKDGETKSELLRLTEREMQVLRMLANGATNHEIASALVISDHTAAFHVKNILGKLHTSSRTQAVAIALRSGLVAPPGESKGQN